MESRGEGEAKTVFVERTVRLTRTSKSNKERQRSMEKRKYHRSQHNDNHERRVKTNNLSFVARDSFSRATLS